MDKIEKLYNIVDWFCRFILLGMTGVVTIIVIGRFVFHITPGWGEEIAILCMIWFGLLSSAMAEHRDIHIRIKFWDTIFPTVIVKALRRFFYFAKLLFAGILVVQGIRLTIFNIPSQMMGVPLSEAVVYASGPIAGTLMIIFLLARFKKEILS